MRHANFFRKFLYEATHHGLHCASNTWQGIEHPGGGEAILRKLTRHWLTQHPHVLAFATRRPVKGSGAANFAEGWS